MSDDTRRILDLLAQGKLTVDEAQSLLKALGASDAPAADAAPRPEPHPRFIRIAVVRKGRSGDDARGYAWPGFAASTMSRDKEVNIRVPVSLVRSGMRLGAIVPGRAGDIVSQALRDRGIDVDLSKIDADQLESVLKDMGEITVDVDHGRAQVRISAE